MHDPRWNWGRLWIPVALAGGAHATAPWARALYCAIRQVVQARAGQVPSYGAGGRAALRGWGVGQDGRGSIGWATLTGTRRITDARVG